ncbi:MAG: RNA polymerase sigma factor [Phototrophicaceae bacterium]|jgi:RNA polymerase sigma factor (sigma-70 family)
MDEAINEWVVQAQNGSKEALEAVVRQTEGYIYNLALRMLQVPMDAEDATQEILIKMVTHLHSFRAESAFTTWMYRIACNHLLTMQKRTPNRQTLSFEALSSRLEYSGVMKKATMCIGLRVPVHLQRRLR